MPPDNSPYGWGQDELSRYLDATRNNIFATFQGLPGYYQDVVTLDEVLERLIKDAVKPRPFFAMQFVIRSHAAFRVAVGSTMAGQVNEAHALMRLVLEQSAYALFISEDEGRFEVWIRRHDGEQELRAMKKAFHNSEISKVIRSKSPRLGDLYDRFYQDAIDYGAHPNERGISISTFFDELDDGGVKYNTMYLHGDGMVLRLALKRLIQIGIWALRVAQNIYPDRMKVLGVNHKIEELASRY